jgi:hypothetical protein
VQDAALRTACFLALDVLCATHGEDVPYRGGLEFGFSYRGRRVPFLSRYKGIHRTAAQESEAALSINTSFDSPYDDEAGPDGFFYAYRSGSPDQPDNRALRAAFAHQVPLVYFIATRPWYYRPLYPVFVVADDPVARGVRIAPGRMVGPLDEREPMLIDDQIERRYDVREARIRLHQARFRGRVLLAYDSRCTICRLRAYPAWVRVRRAAWAFLKAISPLASWRRARWFSSFFDQRIRSARLRLSHEWQASTTQRRARQPGRCALRLISSPRLRMCGVSP